MSAAATEAEARRRRTRYPITLAVTIGCYVLAAMAGMFFLTDNVGIVLQILLWIVHGVVLILLIEKLGTAESSLYAALFNDRVRTVRTHHRHGSRRPDPPAPRRKGQRHDRERMA
ncbi:hypothetical protein ACFY20_07225 [Streptomyces sp. NPDC001312]|uniref:hypothetical protein n=1 Tax=Streptomyces sp. NPDC001312 TaxID=3364561 RepID=UPI0036B9EA45